MESIQKKQLYLRQKIIDAGHDAEQFIQYCSNEHELVDLEDWPMSKLKTVVELFTKMKNKTTQKKQQSKKDHDNDWGTFQSETHTPKIVQKKQQFNHNNNLSHNQPHTNATKTGHLVFSQADWDIFMGCNPNPNTNANMTVPLVHQINIKHAFQQPIIPKSNYYPSLDTFNLEKTQKQSNKSQQINLPVLNQKLKSQKSQSQSKKVEQSKEIKKEAVETQIKSQLEGKDNPLSPPSQEIKKKDFQEKSPINLVNIKLATIKSKVVPKLPQINDVHINKTQQIARNFLQSDYTLYYIHFTPGNHCIQRKFTDLRKLRTILQKIYPHIRLPYLQPEGWLNSSQGKDSQTLAKYKWMVIDFIKYIIIRNQQLKNSQIVRKFCGFSTNPKNQKQNQILSRQQFKKMLQGYESFPRPKYIGQLCLNQNKITIPPIKNGQKLISNTNNLMMEVDTQYEKLRKQFQNLFYNYELISKSFVQITSTFQNLQNLIKKYNYDNNQSKEIRVYDGLRQMTNKMQNTINEQYIVFKSRLKNVFRYEKDNMNTLKELFDSKNKIHYQYVKQGYPSLSSTNKTSNGQLQVDSNISIEEPSRNNKNTLCIQEIFWSYVTKQEIRNYWEQLRKKINEQLTLIAYDQLDNENDNLNFWNSVIKKCVV